MEETNYIKDSAITVVIDIDITSQTLRGGPPFNKSTADTILRSTDGIDFHVRQSILIEVSLFFNAMFSLSQLLENRKRKEVDNTEYKNGVRLLIVEESGRILEKILLPYR